MNRRIKLPPVSLAFGILLMIAPSSPPSASDSAPADTLLITDFTSTSPDLGWFVVNDNVMGGRSDGDFDLVDGVLRFAGRTNTNGGGFSSIRTRPMQLDLSDYDGIRVRVKGDGRRYTWRLTTDARWRGRQISYWADFDTQNGEWTSVDVPFSSFIPQFRGTRLDGPSLDTSNVSGMGLMIYDNKDGAFKLQLADVRAWTTSKPFTLDQYRWQKRVLVVSAAASDDERLKEQLANVSSTAAEFADRDMALVALLGDGMSMAEDRKLRDSEADRVRTTLGIDTGIFAVKLIGKDGSVKLSKESVTSMNEIYALIDTMPMRRKEMADQN
jgi:hypothetical protein